MLRLNSQSPCQKTLIDVKNTFQFIWEYISDVESKSGSFKKKFEVKIDRS